MIEWLKAKSPADVGIFYDDQYRRGGYEALSKGKWSREISKLEEYGGLLDTSKKLLEAGCGHGEFISNVCDRLSCTGIDVSAEGVRMAQERLKDRADIINMAMEDLGAVFGNFDYVVSFGALEHTMNPRKCFDNLLNNVKPGGILFVTVPLEFNNCLRYIMDEKIQETNERFAGASEWLEYFGNRHEAWFVMGETEMKDLAIIVRKENK